MRGVVDQLSAQHGRNFVYAVGEQEAAVQNRDLGLGERHERTVDVGNLIQTNSPCGWRSGRHGIRKLLPPINPGVVIPGWSEGPDPESRDSGLASSTRPGMTSRISATKSSTKTSARGHCGACRRNRS